MIATLDVYLLCEKLYNNCFKRNEILIFVKKTYANYEINKHLYLCFSLIEDTPAAIESCIKTQVTNLNHHFTNFYQLYSKAILLTQVTIINKQFRVFTS